MGYINKIQIDTNTAHLIEPTLYASSTLSNNVYSASLTGFTLVSGVAVQIKFPTTNSSASPKLNINNTGDKTIYYEDTELTQGTIKEEHIYTLIYDSTLNSNNGGWSIVGDFDTHYYRAIKVDGTQKIANNVNTAIDFVGGTNVNLAYDNSGSITINATDTWTPMTGATSSANGTVGYINTVPPSDGYNTKFLRADGTWVEPSQSVLSISTYDVLGGVKPAYSNLSSIGLGTGNSAASYTNANIVLQDRQTETDRYYAVEVDSQGRLYVNVPWTNINSNYQEQLTFDGTYDSTSNPVATVDTVNNAVTELNNNIVQYKSWAINGLANSCNITDNITDKTQVLSLVVTSGFSNLKGALSWEVTTNNNSYQLIISSASAVSGTANNIAVSGYVIITNGTDLDNSNI